MFIYLYIQKKSGRIIRFVGRLAMHFHVSRDDKIMEDFDEISKQV